MGVWFDRKLLGNVHLEKMVKKAEERVAKVMWLSSRVNVQVEVDRQDVVGAYRKTKFGAYSRNVVVRGAQCVQEAGVGTNESEQANVRGKQ